jgi:hypothetical protein
MGSLDPVAGAAGVCAKAGAARAAARAIRVTWSFFMLTFGVLVGVQAMVPG